MKKKRIDIGVNMETKMRLWSYYCMVRWFVLLPVLLPLILIGRLRQRLAAKQPDVVKKLTLIELYNREAKAREYDEKRDNKVCDERWSELHRGWHQDDGTLITEYSTQHTWMGEYLHDLVPGRLYNVVKAIERGEWSNGNECCIDRDLEKAFKAEAKRRKVMKDAEKHEKRNSQYTEERYNASDKKAS